MYISLPGRVEINSLGILFWTGMFGLSTKTKLTNEEFKCEKLLVNIKSQSFSVMYFFIWVNFYTNGKTD